MNGQTQEPPEKESNHAGTGTATPLGTPVDVASGAAALGRNSIAAGERAVVAQGDVGGSIVTGSGNLIIGDLATGLQGQALRQSLQALLSQALASAIRPQIEDLFQVVRDPAHVPAALFGSGHRHLPVRPYDVPYQPRPGETTSPLRRDRAVLVQGRPGLGRTRYVAELARQRCADGWTVCVARLDNCRKMGEPAGILPDKQILCIVDDLHRHVRAGGDESAPYLDRLAACLRLFEQDPGTDVLLLATVPAGDDRPDMAAHPLWQSFAVTTLPELPAGTLQTILGAAANLAGVTLPEDQRASMIADSDGTPKTMVANVNQAGVAGERLTLDHWHNTWRGTWEEAFRDARGRYPLADAIYEAVSLLQAAGLPARPAYVQALAAAPARKANVAETIAALVQRGLLRADRNALAAFAEEQIEVSLQSVGKALPDLAQQWGSLVTTVTTSAGAPVTDMAALAETLNDHARHADAERVATAGLDRDPGHGEASFQRGLARARQDNYRGAVADFTTALAADRRPDRAHLMRGLARFMLADYPGAEDDFTAAIAGGERLAYKGRGLARIFLGAFADAVLDLTEALAAAPEEAELYYLRALAQYALKEKAAALADFTDAIAAGYDGPPVYFGRGWLHWQAGNPAAAEADFTHTLQETDNAFLYLLRGTARHQQGNPAGAETDFTEAIARQQDDAYLTLLQEIGKAVAEEEADLATLLAARPEWARTLVQALPGVELPEETPAETLVGLGQFWGRFMEEQLAGEGASFAAFRQLAGLPYLSRGHARLALAAYAEAAADFTSAADLGVDPAATLYGLGMAQLGLSDAQSAVASLTGAMAAGQEAADAYYWRGFGYLALDAHEAAVADFTDAIARGRDDAVVYALRGRARVALDRLRPAEADFTSAIDRNPADPAGYFMRGAVRYDLGRYREAISDFNKAVAGGYEGGPLYSLRGWSHFRQGAYGPAEADFTAALAHDPDEAKTYYGRAAARFNQERYTAAEADYTAAITRGLNHPFAYLERGAARLEIDDVAGAEADATKALELGFEDGRAYHIRGWARLRQGEGAAARADLDAAIARGFAEAVTYYGRALVAYHLDDYEHAVADYTEAIVRGLDTPAVYAERGAARLKQGEYAGAEADLSRAIGGGVEDGDVYAQRARARVNLEAYKGAVTDYTAAITRGHDDVDTVRMRGFAHFQLGAYEQAIADFSETLRHGPANAGAFLLRSLAYYSLGRYDPAAADATQVITQEQENAFAWQIRASARAHLGRVASGREDCERAQQLAPDDPLTYECWGELYLAQGAYDKAVTSYEAALRREPDTGRHFSMGLVYLLSGRVDEGVRAYGNSLGSANAADLQAALREMDHWLGRRQDPLAAGVVPALQEMRQQLEAALAAQRKTISQQ